MTKRTLVQELREHSANAELNRNMLTAALTAQAADKIEELLVGFEGCCYACEPVGLLNKQLLEERDEARRMWCESEPAGNCLSVDDMYRRARAEAERREWDCYGEETP